MRNRRISPALLAMLLSGCTVGPDFVRPSIDAPQGFDELSRASPQVASRAVADGKAQADWWRQLNDPMLAQLVERALSDNPDMLRAAARVREARAERDAATGALFPSLDANASYTRQKISDRGAFSAIGGAGGSTPPAAGQQGPPSSSTGANSIPPFDLYQAGFDARWEIDLFGGTRRSVEAAEADLEAARAAEQGVRVTLAGEVARAYVEFRGAQALLALARATARAQDETAQLTQDRARHGLNTELDTAQAVAQARSVAADIPTLQTQTRQGAHLLATLVGQPPAALMQELEAEGPVPTPPARIAVGIPSELLRRRPDVRQAEAQLHGATARVGVATAELFPKITLVGSVGNQATKASDLLKAASRFWSFGPQLAIPIFEGGRLRAEVEAADAREAQAFQQYRSTVLAALREAEDALAAFDREQLRRDQLASALQAAKEASRLARDRWNRGLSDYLNVLDADRRAIAAEQALARSKVAVATDLVSLYKALGGGSSS